MGNRTVTDKVALPIERRTIERRKFMQFIFLAIAIVLLTAFPCLAQISNYSEFNRTFTHHTTNVNGVRLHYVMGGGGEPVILLHGFASTWYMWRHVMPELAKRYTVIVPDLRGAGDSAKPAIGYDKRTMAEDIYQLARQLGHQRIFLVGHDIGFMVAYAYAAAHSEDVRRLVLLEGLLPGVEPWEESKRSPMFWHFGFHSVPNLPEALVQGRERIYLNQFWQQGSYNPVAITEADKDEYLRSYAAPGGMRAAFETYRAFPEDEQQNREYVRRKLTMPVLAFGGAQAIGEAVIKTARAVATNVRGGVIERCGHWIPEERPEYLTEQLLTFFGEEKLSEHMTPRDTEIALAKNADAPQTAAITRFKAHIPDNVLVDLRRRLAEAKWPDQLPGTTWEYGANISKVRQLADYWQRKYEWPEQEAWINRFDQFTTEIDGQRIHFIHERSPRADAIPLMLIHGWPGSIVEFLGLIEPLTRPKDRSAPAFHVVIPSLPGFGFSGPTTSRGWDTQRMAKAFVVLMDRLGYSKYGVQGGDWGSVIARQMAHQAPAHVIGIHLNFLPVPPPNPEALTQMSEEERRRYSQFWEEGRSGFFKLQSTEPQTAAYGLTDSPVGWLAWMAVKFQDFTDNDGDFLHAVDRDTFLTNVTLYWVTGTVGSSMRIYREHYLSGGDSALPRIETPAAYAVFPKEVIASPYRWIDQKYNVIQRTEMPKGGHFAALEQPDLLSQDIQAFFAKLYGK